MKLSSHQYGKARVRVARIIREGDHHQFHEAEVQVMLSGNFESSYSAGDNSLVVPTDTMKNTVNILAQTELTAEIEIFGLALGRHFLAKYAQVEKCQVTLTARSWQRIGSHSHAFTGNDNCKPWAEVIATRDNVIVRSGIRDLLILKSTGSGFADFPRCDFTTLPETTDRICATVVAATWDFSAAPHNYAHTRENVIAAMLRVFADNYSPSVQATLYQMAAAAFETAPEISRIHLALPNKHYLPVNLAPFGHQNPNEVFTPTDEPHGQIEASFER